MVITSFLTCSLEKRRRLMSTSVDKIVSLFDGRRRARGQGKVRLLSACLIAILLNASKHLDMVLLKTKGRMKRTIMDRQRMFSFPLFLLRLMPRAEGIPISFWNLILMHHKFLESSALCTIKAY